jgi:hypothetical protein
MDVMLVCSVTMCQYSAVKTCLTISLGVVGGGCVTMCQNSALGVDCVAFSCTSMPCMCSVMLVLRYSEYTQACDSVHLDMHRESKPAFCKQSCPRYFYGELVFHL